MRPVSYMTDMQYDLAPDTDNYLVFENGEVFSIRVSRFMKASEIDGYKWVALRIDGR